MSRVSVIVPVYNAEKYLRECVERIVAQTLQDIEIIFVDDGSTDGSLSIIQEYAKKDNRIQIVKGEHRGGGAARNLGLEKATGDYLAFFDSDDLMELEMLEKAYNQAEKETADVTVFSVRFWHEATGAVTDEVCGLRVENLPERETFCYKDMKQYIFNSFHNWPWNKLFRRAFIMEHGIRFQEIMRTNDLLFTAKALILAERITTVREYLAMYRVRLTDSCQASNNLAPLDFYKAFYALKEFLEEQGIYEEVRQSYVNHALDGCIANLNVSDFSPTHKLIFQQLKEEIFEKLDILGREDDYFYSMNVENKNMERFHNILAEDYEGFLLYRANELNDLFHERLYQSYFDFRKIVGLEEKQRALEEEIRNLQEEKYMLQLDLDNVYQSFSYRFGHKVTAPVRAVGRIVRGKKEDDNEETVDGDCTDL